LEGTYIPSSLDLLGHRRTHGRDVCGLELLARDALLALLVPVVWVNVVELQLDAVERHGGVVRAHGDRVSEGVEQRRGHKDAA
jgi:hypothetical protein